MGNKDKKQKKSHLCDLARAELNELKEMGISPTWEQVCQINDLSRKVETPRVPTVTATGRPVPVGNIVLWPFTVQGGEWYAWICDRLSDDEERVVALGYALAHGREDGAFAALYGVAQAKEGLDRWRKVMACTYAELSEAANEVIGEVPEVEEGAKSTDWDSVIQTLVANAGGEPGMWCRSVSQDFIAGQLMTLAAQARTQDAPPDPNSPEIVATVELGRAILEIKKCHSQK